MRSAHTVITTSVLALTLSTAGAAHGDTDHRPASLTYSGPREHIAQAPADTDHRPASLTYSGPREHIAQAAADTDHRPASLTYSGPREHIAQAPADAASDQSAVRLAGFASDVGNAPTTSTLRFLDVRGAVSSLDVGPAGSSVGDTLFFDNELWNRSATTRLGRFVSRCTTVTSAEHHCQGSLLLPKGSLEVTTTTDFSAPIVAAVVGGTGAYEGAVGAASISPTGTEGTSTLVVHLVPSGRR